MEAMQYNQMGIWGDNSAFASSTNLLCLGLTFATAVDDFNFCFKGWAVLSACETLADFVDSGLSSVRIALVLDLE